MPDSLKGQGAKISTYLKSTLGGPASCSVNTWEPIYVTTAPVLIHCPPTVLKKAREDDPSAGTLATHVAAPALFQAPWLWPGPAQSLRSFWECISEWKISLSFCDFAFEIILFERILCK